MAAARIFMAIAAIFGGLGVAAGAFASHSLKAYLSKRSLEIFATGARYQMYHALALLFVALLLAQIELPNPPTLVASGISFIVGIVLFSGSLYALSLTGIQELGIVAPIGGIVLIVGWGCLAAAALSFK
ncbi:MAG TPA: DUF423 domain-containing protein [Oscillatoriales cyanobacterium M59_W2019_021]|nr:MAG: DUF423 domain-containing protein [Cyanobacteria bacterium J055]HIK31410.1 DUF423 domain-containing protein [Oscillatoriales cyanobacterium M4454_W2019_049]HIK50092.1 DUF423 domain-containing protein [Oscillatoriales cyanobacterium M59_W2019_021]